MKLFEYYDKKKKEIYSFSIEDLRKNFESLESSKRIDILIKWLSITPLTNLIFNSLEGIEHIKEYLLKEVLK